VYPRGVEVGWLVTWQVVVEMIVSVVTCPTAQLVTAGAQEVIVYVFVAYTVDVVYSWTVESYVGLSVK
jgi:hypothetical protein